MLNRLARWTSLRQSVRHGPFDAIHLSIANAVMQLAIEAPNAVSDAGVRAPHHHHQGNVGNISPRRRKSANVPTAAFDAMATSPNEASRRHALSRRSPAPSSVTPPTSRAALPMIPPKRRSCWGGGAVVAYRAVASSTSWLRIARDHFKTIVPTKETFSCFQHRWRSPAMGQLKFFAMFAAGGPCLSRYPLGYSFVSVTLAVRAC